MIVWVSVPENPKSNNTQNLLNLPKEVCIELHPANNESWLRVHCLSQNPRVRTKLSLQRRLSNLVEYLEKRWSHDRIKDSECRTLCGTSLPNNCQTDDRCLRVRPHSSGDLNNVLLNKSYFNSQTDLSFTAYLKNLYNDELRGVSKKSKTNKSKDKDLSSDPNRSENVMKSPNSEQNSGVNEENCDKSTKNDNQLNKSFESEGKSDEDEPPSEAERSLTLLRMLEKMNEMNEEIHATDEEDDKEDDEQNKDEEEEREDLPSPETNANVCLPEPPANATLAQWLSGTDADPLDNNDVEEDNEEKKTTNTIESSENQLFQLSAERARKGWSLKECRSVTIGELYLLFRCPKKILLEYVWEPIVQNVDNSCPDIEESAVSSTDDTVGSKEEEKKCSDESKKNSTQSNIDMLEKLLFAANMSLQSLKRPANTSTAQTQKKRRIKPTPAPLRPQGMLTTPMESSSQLLSNVISNTIFNDSNSNDGTNKSENSVTKVTAMTTDPNNEPKTGHNFIVPKSPAPKAVNKSKNRNICGDPALIQEALRQLQSSKYTRRQRRPTPKPVFGQNKPLLPRGSTPITTTAVSASVSTQQPIYVIPSHQTLHINAMSGVTSNATVLSQTLPVVNMTGLNANEFRQTIKSHTTIDSRSSRVTNSQTSVVDRLINIQTSNIPVIQIDPISSVSVPIISSSMSSTPAQTLKQTLDSYSVSKSASIHSISLLERQNTDRKSDSDLKDTTKRTEENSSISSIGLKTNRSEVISSSTEDSTERLISNPHISSLLEISLPEPPFSDNSCSSLTNSFSIEKRPFERLNLPNISQNTVSDTTSLKHRLTNDPTLPTSESQSSSLASPPIERHKLSDGLQPEHQWLNGESCDLSLGTLLNTCESPVKTVTVRDTNSMTNDVNIGNILLFFNNFKIDFMFNL